MFLELLFIVTIAKKNDVLTLFLANQYKKFIVDINEHKLKTLTKQLVAYLTFFQRKSQGHENLIRRWL